jgi:hypothetical protein
VFGRMPSLVDACVKISDSNPDDCHNSAGSGDCEDYDCFACYGVDGHTYGSVLLQGLSEARNLALISHVDKVSLHVTSLVTLQLVSSFFLSSKK